MKKSWIFFILLLIGIVTILYFLQNKSVSYSPEETSFVSVTRNLPFTYLKNVPFTVSLEIKVNESVPTEGGLFFGEIIEGGTIYGIEPNNSVSVEGGALLWKNLPLENQVISYKVVSSSSSVRVVGKWGFDPLIGDVFSCDNCEGRIFGDLDVSSFSIVNLILGNTGGSSSGGGSSGGGGESKISNDSSPTSNEEVDSNIPLESSEGERVVKGSVSTDSTNKSIWPIILILVLLVAIVIWYILKRRNQNNFEEK